MIQYEDIINEIQFFEEKRQVVFNELEKLKEMVPEKARLRAVKNGNIYHYFIRKDGYSSNGEYIRKKDRKIAAILAQIEYDEKLLVILQNTLETYNKYKEVIIGDPFELALDKLSPGKRELVKIPFLSDDKYIVEWLKQKYEGVMFKENYPEFYTRQGLRVRSKSEVIIADILDELAVPFFYEKPLQLKNGIVHPDFTLLNIRQRQEIYWEHFGMMDDMDYRNNAFNKIRNYESSGFYQHDSLIWTFETGKNPLNTKEIRKMILKLKKSLGYD
ncbi:MAG: hypothetical protein IJ167_06520 [Lachnospiraceae bacterium]|nr:hypothetical protein [Lachnospiraceae bacterium]